MTLYLVKWEDGTSALVTAEDAEHLVYLLDQLADPGAASWMEYDGPLWLEFPRVDERLGEGEIDPTSIGLGRPVPAETDHGGDFEEEVLRLVSPRVAALREQAMRDERAVTRDELVRAVEADLVSALPGSVFGRAHGPEH